MTNQSEIRGEVFFGDSNEHPMLRFCPQNHMVREANKAKKINTAAQSAQCDFSMVQLQSQLTLKEQSYLWNEGIKRLWIAAQYDKVVAIPQVMTDSQPVLYVLVEFVQVNIGQKLGREVAERKSTWKAVQNVC